MPESVTDRPTKAHEQVFLLSKQARYFYDADAIREAQTPESLADHLRRKPSDRANGAALAEVVLRSARIARTIGFEPSCDHDADPTAGTVLDPFRRRRDNRARQRALFGGAA